MVPRGDRRVECPWINKYRSLLIIYDNTTLRAPLRTLDGQRAGRLYIRLRYERGTSVRCYAMRCESATRKGEAGWDPVTSLPSDSRQGAMNNWKFPHPGEFLGPVLMKRGFSVEKGDASSSWLSKGAVKPLQVYSQKRKTGISRVNRFVNHSRKRDVIGLIIPTTISADNP